MEQSREQTEKPQRRSLRVPLAITLASALAFVACQPQQPRYNVETTTAEECRDENGDPCDGQRVGSNGYVHRPIVGSNYHTSPDPHRNGVAPGTPGHPTYIGGGSYKGSGTTVAPHSTPRGGFGGIGRGMSGGA